MLVSKDNFEKLSCVEAFISMVAFGGGTHSWTLPISFFFEFYAVQKDNRNMMFPSIIFHLFGILLDILVLIFGVGTFAAVFMVIKHNFETGFKRRMVQTVYWGRREQLRSAFPRRKFTSCKAMGSCDRK